MTLPPSLQDLESHSAMEPGLTRVTVLLNGLHLDVALPTEAEIHTYVGELLTMANAQLAVTEAGAVRFEDTAGRWTLATLDGTTIDAGQSLSTAAVYDGDVLVVADVAAPATAMLFDDVDPQNPSPTTRWWSRHHRPVVAFGAAVAAVFAWCWLVPQTFTGILPAAVTLILGVAAAVGAGSVSRTSADSVKSVGMSVVAVPLLFTGSSMIVPNSVGVTSLPLAFAVLALTAQLLLQVTRAGHAWHGFVLAGSVLGGVASAAVSWWHPSTRAVGAVLATVAVMVVYLAPRLTILAAKLPVPRVPTAGEPLDDIEMHGLSSVDGVGAVGLQVIPTEENLLQRVRRANQYLTGILVAAAATAAVGCYLAVDISAGFYWQGALFAVVTATVLCLRGRSHHDVVQAATMIGAGLAIALVLPVKIGALVDGWQVRAALVVVAVVGLAMWCGLIAPRREFSPVMRRWVEILEWVAIGLIFPLCFWIIGLYGYLRGLRL